jgi:type I restriction enzyme, S subunit
VSDVFGFVKSYAFSRDNLVNGTVNDEGIGNIHYGDIHSTFTSPSIDLSQISIPTIKDRSFVPKNEDLLKDGDLIMADASEDYAGVGVTVSVHGLKDRKVVGGLHTFVLRDVDGKTDEYYRQYIFRNPVIRNALQKIANGVSVYGISKTALSKVLLPLPPLPEQRRIVSILEAWDKAIDELNGLIALKQQIKNSLMGKILTGLVRLKGFGESWISVELGDVCEFYNGYAFKSSTYHADGIYKIITIANVQNGKMDTTDTKKIDLIPDNVTNEQKLKIGDILISMTGNVGRICLVSEEGCLLNQRVGKIVPKEIDKNLLFYILRYPRFLASMIESAQGGAQDNVSVKDIKKYKFLIPTSGVEQAAISKILLEADAELRLLEKKLNNLQFQKTYLLNALMAGVIRTPDAVSIVTKQTTI